MTNFEKIQYIDEYNMLSALNKMVERFSRYGIEDKLLAVNTEVKKQFKLYSEDVYNQYLIELEAEYKDDMDGYLNFLMSNLSETSEKFRLFKKINQKINNNNGNLK